MSATALETKGSLNVKVVSHNSESDTIPKQIRILDASLTEVETFWITNTEFSRDLKQGIYVVKVVLASGEEMDKVTEIKEGKLSKIEINIGSFSPRETQEWAYLNKSYSGDPRKQFHSFIKEKNHEPTIPGVSAQLWRYENLNWISSPFTEMQNKTVTLYGDTYIIKTNQQLQILQLEGEHIPLRCINLPPGHDVQCMIKLAKGPVEAVHPLDVTVSTKNMVAESLLAIMTSGDTARAKTLFAASRAEELLSEKMIDPAAAAIGAYYLLKIKDLARMHNWANNLADMFSWLPDGAIIHAWQMIQQSESVSNLTRIRGRLLEAVNRGIPVYTEGLRLLVDGLNQLSYHFDKKDAEIEAAVTRIRFYSTNADWSQETTTFTGIYPNLSENTSKKLSKDWVKHLKNSDFYSSASTIQSNNSNQ